MNHIETVFKNLKKIRKRAFIPYITAGDPDLEQTFNALKFFAEEGADIIELGVPFSDPMADGETIQRAMERALVSKTNLPGILRLVKKFKESYSTPIILMGYYNPFYKYGLENFAKDAVSAGVDGVLTVDLPPEEAREFVSLLKKYKITPVFLATPTSDVKRLLKIKNFAKGFIYFVSVTGVTGERTDLSEDIKEKLNLIKKTIGLPVVLGFGISTPEIIKKFYKYADGFVVGSAIVKRWERYIKSGDRGDFEKFFRVMVESCYM
ncbi:MAG: tryptophan synthase subunit alpha [Proteobacteria bacterium]|nr:tryptophan synthase subunit alpha [Pseudomonadota bacterium]